MSNIEQSHHLSEPFFFKFLFLQVTWNRKKTNKMSKNEQDGQLSQISVLHVTQKEQTNEKGQY